MKDVYRQLIYNDKKSSFKEILETVPIHIKNLQFLTTEIFKVYRNISLSIVKQLFQSSNNVTIHDNFQNLITRSKKCFSWNRKCFISWPKNPECCC